MATPAALFGQGISFPPRIGTDGRLAWSSGAANVREAVRVILMTDPGERLMRPSFGAGLRSLLFEPNVPATHRLVEERIVHGLARWEPRLWVEDVRIRPIGADEAEATIEYRLVATGQRESASVTVRLEG